MAHRNDAGESDQDDALRAIYWRDEILQLLYWLKGEGLLEEAAPDDLRRFLEGDPGQLDERLAQLAQDGYLESVQGNRYRLSVLGDAEGRRRFIDEFAPLLGRESHLECGDSECECHTSDAACPRL